MSLWTFDSVTEPSLLVAGGLWCCCQTNFRLKGSGIFLTPLVQKRLVEKVGHLDIVLRVFERSEEGE